MPRIPEPEFTPRGLMYEGRRLDRPDEEVVDQGLRFDVGTLFTRRRVLSLIGAGAATMGLAACATGASSGSSATTSAATGSTSSGEIPDETAGPYPGDGSNGADVLENAGIVRSDIRSSIDGGATAAGVPMTLTLNILDMANGDAPFEGVAVYVWHCDADGNYSMYSSGVEDETYLRGVQVADSDGNATFTSIIPACYSGRWPHIHFEVYPDVASITDSTNAIATSQVALPEDVCTSVYALDIYDGSPQNLAQVTLDNDNVFGDDGGELQLGTATGDVTSGYTITLTARVDTATTPTAGAAPSGGGGQGGPGGTRPTGAPPQ
ncbi:intradiol ring-cleavage dioxygenase [Rathayibacter caricis]|uniref:intradiol ring-cleavage dioxygenase n=1 Tax=Rathayibacter caricis TaxID=110936 RepID=UPI001FB37DB5|nr:intradiol ring-cleavage dioxygenase [Rathayibacter caricis]MCJ1697828.1 intradiol ring-cleavage dioxygenase [Rathayibacter caricis]